MCLEKGDIRIMIHSEFAEIDRQKQHRKKNLDKAKNHPIFHKYFYLT